MEVFLGVLTSRAGLDWMRRSRTALSRIAARTPWTRLTVVGDLVSLRSAIQEAISVWRRLPTDRSPHFGWTWTRQALSSLWKVDGLTPARWEASHA